MSRLTNVYLAACAAGLIFGTTGCSLTSLRKSRQDTDPLSATADSQTRAERKAKRKTSPTDDAGKNRVALARLSERREQFDQAERLYRAAIKEAPDNPLPYHRLAVMAARRGDATLANGLFDRALELDPTNGQLLGDYGYAYYLQNQLEDAEKLLRRASKLKPKDQAITNNLAMVLGEQGRLDESFGLFKRVNTEAKAYANMAYVHAQLGQFEQAKKNYGRALTLDPELKSAAEALVQLARHEKVSTGEADAAIDTRIADTRIADTKIAARQSSPSKTRSAADAEPIEATAPARQARPLERSLADRAQPMPRREKLQESRSPAARKAAEKIAHVAHTEDISARVPRHEPLLDRIAEGREQTVRGLQSPSVQHREPWIRPTMTSDAVARSQFRHVAHHTSTSADASPGGVRFVNSQSAPRTSAPAQAFSSPTVASPSSVRFK